MAIETTTEAVRVPRPHRYTVADYYRMAEVGILGPTDRVQLIDGVIYDMPPIGPDHAESVDDLNTLFSRRYGTTARVRIQQPIHLPDRSEPEPDVVLAHAWPGVRRPYGERHPTVGDAFLVVEVAVSTLDFDLGQKARMYAQNQIEDLWVLDVRGERLIVHRVPSPEGYRSVVEHRRGDSVAPLAFPDMAITVDELLGDPE